MVFEVGIGMSQSWDLQEAGQEAITQALSKLTRLPTFILLFSTIHYEKHNGFQQILNTIYKHIPAETPLVGGTVAGFINPMGCYTRGVTAAAFYSDEIDIAIGIGHNTKRNPRKAAQTVIEQIKNKGHLRDNFIISIYSAGSIPTFPGFPRENVIRSKIKAKIGASLMGISLQLLQKGVGRDEEYLQEVADAFSNSRIVSGSMIDDITCLRNYQFYKRQVFSNSAIALSIKTKLKGDVITKTGLIDTGKEFEVTKLNKDKTIIFEINQKPAREEFLKILGWPPDFLTNRLYDRIWYYPVSFFDDKKEIPSVIPLIMGDYLLSSFPIKSKKMKILTTNGKKLIEATKESVEYFGKKTSNPLFGFISSCGIRLLTLKSKELVEHEILRDYFKNKPFLLIFVAGEGTYSPETGLKYGNDTINTMVFWE